MNVRSLALRSLVTSKVAAGLRIAYPYAFRSLVPIASFSTFARMAPRRSARLLAAGGPEPATKPPLSETAKQKSSKTQSNGISKPRKAALKGGKKKTTSTPQATDVYADIFGASDQTTRTKDAVSSTNGTAKLESTPPPFDRPVDPHRTNAALLTPHGSSLVAYQPGAEDVSPSKTGLPRPAATTGNLLEKAIDHLITAEPRLKPLIDKHPCNVFSPRGLSESVDPFQSLVSSIISQQVSGAAAKSIKNKFVSLFNSDVEDEVLRTRRFPTPEEVAMCDIATLRTAGLSQRKAEYIQGLAEKFATGELSAQILLKASDEELVEKLVAVRGLGKWSVEMFALFSLKRTDVFSTTDLGVQRGCAAFVGRDVSKLKAKGGGKYKYMSEKDMLELAAKFSPYRSLFMWYMWRVEDVDVEALG
ncbi:DNA-3-methyladenine glycosylase, putative [Paecilomyces variotii No. 5]|uniref:DNA-3-methyladenine glycosylase, putative n=1 Tax=Byssochlamys spectabilis (strain No. 5 / NBRC 109023) TaxID=1356009 RepID=V5FU24_BYSSN|nr:DNA-3-methyladenine glycosylase, putative [Paecilomyces variotii No. 5]